MPLNYPEGLACPELISVASILLILPDQIQTPPFPGSPPCLAVLEPWYYLIWCSVLNMHTFLSFSLKDNTGKLLDVQVFNQ